MAIALFPGSFDPITNGHVDVIKQASKLFAQVYVVAMTNTSKNYLFSIDQRVSLIEDAVQDYGNVTVLSKPDALTVDVAREISASVIVRGVRNSSDFLYEQQIAATNKQIAPEITTALLFTKVENSFVASSIVKEVAQFGGQIDAFLPKMAASALKDKLGPDNNEKD
ncbi:pantetheine-phosphate adenylyltransferase [Lactobacillus sp. ESL0684]|uniref:pantetheine-phosphate adenylyltransferase n=1 Tax=unclassified Lactobacillus TaxID=2620435 RepID=UPI0023F8A7A4|nr:MULTISPECIES: pantetheine-phosphate adenylyltransferase [unclassified Lactobacillus]WEV40613.1 pantetheine-phosphate adenylyltransferase [Lactobacillus sp. ESL0681]WEV42867.1 pantetheine-phosphate adenylyltransferase [Lactobacillus sp. ESL0684]